MTTTTHIGLTLLEQSQAQKEITVNQALTRLDALLNTGAKSRQLSTPPSTPAAGDVYIIAASPTGAWAGQAGAIAYYDAIWRFISPNEGMSVWVNDEDAVALYNGSAWVVQTVLSQTATSVTLSSAHRAVSLLLTNASAITLTLPTSLPVGFFCQVVQGGAGQVTFSPASGATRRNRQSHTKTAGQYAVCNLLVISNAGGSAAEYVLSGDSAA